MSHSPEDKFELSPHDHKVQLVVSNQGEDDDEIDLGQLIRKVLDGRRVILLCTLLALLVTIVGFGGYNLMMQDTQGTVSTVIAFNFKGIEEGLNPEGEPLNIGEIISKKVLEETITQLGLGAKGIDSEVLRKNITIQGIVPEDVINRMVLINKMAEKDVSQLEKLDSLEYYPSQYKIDLNVTKNMNLHSQEAEQVVMAIIDNYKNYFMNKYNDKKVLSTAITTVELDRYDYSEYVMLVDSQLEIAKTYLEEKELESPDFRSKITGVSFGDLRDQVELIQNTEINNVQSIINTFMVTKNKERLFSIYENKIKMAGLEMQRYKENATSLRKAATDYKKDAMVVLGNEGIDSAMEFTESSETYDQFIIDAVDAENNANTLRYDIELYQDFLFQLNKGNEPGVSVDITPYITQVEEDIAYIAESVKVLVDNVNVTVDEYYTREVFKNSVKMDVPAIYSSGTMDLVKKGIMSVAIAVVLGMMIGVVLALSKGILEDKGQGGSYDSHNEMQK